MGDVVDLFGGKQGDLGSVSPAVQSEEVEPEDTLVPLAELEIEAARVIIRLAALLPQVVGQSTSSLMYRDQWARCVAMAYPSFVRFVAKIGEPSLEAITRNAAYYGAVVTVARERLTRVPPVGETVTPIHLETGPRLRSVD